MPLRDVTGVIFDRGNGPFNESAAREAYHLVMKMEDDETASEFVHHVVNEVIQKTITENRVAVQKHLDKTIAKCLVYGDLDAVAAGMDDEQREEFKKTLFASISKAADYDPRHDQFDPQKHPRDDKGRFAASHHEIDHTRSLNAKAGQDNAIPAHPDFNLSPEEGGMSDADKGRYRAQYAQVVEALRARGGAGFKGENNVRLNYANGAGHKDVRPYTKHDLAVAINPHQGEDVESVDIEPYTVTAGGKVVNLTHTLGAGAAAGAGVIGSKNTNMTNYSDPYAAEGESPFVTQWNSAHPTNSTQQMYNRIGAGSKLIEQSGMGGPRAKMAAWFGSHVGQYGSSAEAVFGPPVRRMAYRYRGTERRPPEDLARAYGAAVNNSKQTLGAQPNRRQGESVEEWQARAAQSHAERVPTWQEREAGREVISRWLHQQAPNKLYTALHLQAGHTPPSEGVLLNKDGQIVTTAVGAADDWYLPFNLKHLTQLKGGEYIRTRSSGGLTPEDVYTGLMTGARRVTVVSRSGTFSIEFDDELRGGRRNNDKALRMTQRYAELLDAVQSGQVRRQDLGADQMNEIRRDIRSQYPGLSAHEFQARVNAKVKERMENPAEIDRKIEDLKAQRAEVEKTRALGKDELEDYNNRLFDLNKAKEFNWRLNGLGYGAAAKALQEQFPYYIKASSEAKVGQQTTALTEHDKGYVEVGALRPTAARANLFGGAVGPNGVRVKPQWSEQDRGGISARTADHAKPKVDRYTGAKGQPREAVVDDDGGGSGSDSDHSSPRHQGGSPEERLAAASRLDEAIDAAVTVKNNLHWARGQDRLNADKETFAPIQEYDKKYRGAENDFAFRQTMGDPREMEKFRQAVKRGVERMRAQGALEDDPDKAEKLSAFEAPGFSQFENKLGGRSGGKYNGKTGYKSAIEDPAAIYDFGAPDRTEIEAAEQHMLPLTGKPVSPGAKGDAELLSTAKMLQTIEAAQMNPLIDTDLKAQYTRKMLSEQHLLPVDEEVLNNRAEREAVMHRVQLLRFDRNRPRPKVGLADAIGAAWPDAPPTAEEMARLPRQEDPLEHKQDHE